MSITILDDGVRILNPECPALDGIILDISFECSAILKNPMRWVVEYVTSSHGYDQTLINTLVGPISVGTSRFALKTDPPKLDELPYDEINLAALLVTAFYNDQEFFRTGYMLYHVQEDPNFDENNPDFTKLSRHISIEKDDITTKVSQIKWT